MCGMNRHAPWSLRKSNTLSHCRNVTFGRTPKARLGFAGTDAHDRGIEGDQVFLGFPRSAKVKIHGCLRIRTILNWLTVSQLRMAWD